MPMKEEVEWVKSSMISCEVSLLAIVFSLAKALACPAARQITIFLLILLLLSLGRSSFCNWAKEGLVFCCRISVCTSAGEPSTRVFKMMFSPSGVGKSLPFLKQLLRIAGAENVTMTRATKKITENRSL